MRQIRRTAGGLAGGLLLLLPVPVLAAEAQGNDQKPVQRPPAITAETAGRHSSRTVPVYNPPRRGTTARTLRVGGGTRGGLGMVQPTISVLAPNDLGATVHDQPTLFWYASRPLPDPVLFTLIAADAVTPSAVVRLNAPMKRGIYAINLADFGIRLERGKAYEWSVSVVADQRRRSHDVVAIGEIEFVPLQDRSGDDYLASAQEGLWYDSVMALSKLLDKEPTDRELRSHREALTQAVGLEVVAKFDRAIEVF